MNSIVSRPSTLPKVFLDSFLVRDIAEPLATFDSDAAATDVRAFMNCRGFDVVGVRHDGFVRAYVTHDALQDGTCGQFAVAIDETVVMDESTTLVDAIKRLQHSTFGLICWLGEVSGIVTTEDLQKPPVRMWLFGLVTLIEMRFTELIEIHLPGETWKVHVSPGRLEKAQAIWDERRRRNQLPRLFDCLQFGDKGRIVACHQGIRNCTVFTSRRQAEETARKLESLRNSLAHAQDILTNDWETIVQLCDFVADRGLR